VKADYLLELLRAARTNRAADTDARSPLRVLDIGCGHGYIHGYLTGSDVHLKLSAIDIAATVVEEARRQNPSVGYAVYGGEKLPYADRSFDVAYTITVMHHVPPPQWPAFVLEMRRVVRPGGMIVVFEHNPINPLTQWIVRTCPIDENAVLLGSRHLARLIGAAGFVDIRRCYILFTPVDRSWARRFDKHLGWLPLGAQYFVAARTSSSA
jgi:SAM-dependent methyltransferase